MRTVTGQSAKVGDGLVSCTKTPEVYSALSDKYFYPYPGKEGKMARPIVIDVPGWGDTDGLTNEEIRMQISEELYFFKDSKEAEILA